MHVEFSDVSGADLPSGSSRAKSAKMPTAFLSVIWRSSAGHAPVAAPAPALGATAAGQRLCSCDHRHSPSIRSRPAPAPAASSTNAENTAGKPRPCRQTWRVRLTGAAQTILTGAAQTILTGADRQL